MKAAAGQAIGQALSKKDHTTVMYLVKRCSLEVKSDPDALKTLIKTIEAMAKGLDKEERIDALQAEIESLKSGAIKPKPRPTAVMRDGSGQECKSLGQSYFPGEKAEIYRRAVNEGFMTASDLRNLAKSLGLSEGELV